jgi:FkbM family methyltransferase
MTVTDPILDIQKEWLDRLVFTGRPVVADVGANIGRFAEEVIGRWPDAQIVCFEPQPVAAGRIGRFAEVRNIALGSRRETLKLYCDPNHGIDMSASFHQPWHDGIDVPVERLDKQCLGRIDLLKVDAEGNELAVMQGAGGLLRPETVRIVQWEFNSFQDAVGVTLDDFVQVLHGYTILEIGRGGILGPVSDLADVADGAHHELVAQA